MNEKLTKQELFNCLYTDFLMLADGEWQPDWDSIEASIDVLLELAKDAEITPIDTREA